MCGGSPARYTRLGGSAPASPAVNDDRTRRVDITAGRCPCQPFPLLAATLPRCIIPDPMNSSSLPKTPLIRPGFARVESVDRAAAPPIDIRALVGGGVVASIAFVGIRVASWGVTSATSACQQQAGRRDSRWPGALRGAEIISRRLFQIAGARRRDRGLHIPVSPLPTGGGLSGGTVHRAGSTGKRPIDVVRTDHRTGIDKLVSIKSTKSPLVWLYSMPAVGVNANTGCWFASATKASTGESLVARKYGRVAPAMAR